MLLTISVTVIAAIMVVAVLFLFPVLLQIRRTARQMEKFLETTHVQIIPLIHDLATLSKEINGILRSIHRQVDRVEDSITTFQDIAVRLRELEEGILNNVSGPLLKLTTLIIAASRWKEVFARMLRR
jgi:uncharacterized protein YoxC